MQKQLLMASSILALTAASRIDAWGKHAKVEESSKPLGMLEEPIIASAQTSAPAEQSHYPLRTAAGSASVAKGVTTSATFLYWQAKEDGLDYAFNARLEGVGGGGAPSFVAAKVRSKTVNFSWKPGLQVSLGYIFPEREQWDLSLAWTYLHSKAHGSLHKNPDTIATNQIIPIWVSFLKGNIAAKASAHWTLNYNVFDLALARNFFVGNWLAFKPAIGIRGAWINQDYNIRYLATADQINYYNSSSKCDNDFAGGGVRLGTDMQMFLSSGWSILGNIAGSLIYGRFSVKQFSLGRIFPAGGISIDESIDLKDNLTRISPNVEGKLGIQWQRFFHNEKFRVSLAAFYNLSYWLEQNQLHNLLVFFNAGTSLTYTNDDQQIGNLQLQGGSFELRLEF